MHSISSVLGALKAGQIAALYRLKQTKMVILALWLCFFFSATSSADEHTVSICIDDWPPHIVNAGNERPGPMTRAANQIFKLAGYETTIVWAPWQRCIENVKLGIWDTSLGWSKTPARLEHLLFSRPLTTSYHLFMSLKSSEFDWKEWVDLKGLRIGMTEAYSYGEAFEEHRSKGLFVTETAQTDSESLKNLLEGRVDVFPLNKDTAWSIAKRNLSQEEVTMLALHPRPLSKNRKTHVIFSRNKRGEVLMKDFEEAVAGLEESGEFSKMFEYLRH